ncbi:MAG TPA: DUF86 domain-containing protein [Thermoanaerobaculia bacterium]|nr:DUF86 domain-containing protein [Thermoanaerobaculia bacterium]
MVKLEVVSRKVARASAWLNDAEEILGSPGVAARTEVRGRDLASFYLFLTIQECIDLAAHWVSDAGWDLPDDAGASFDLLAEHGVLDRDLATTLRGAVGLRNRIAHGYATVDHGRIHDELESGVVALRNFLTLVSAAAGL